MQTEQRLYNVCKYNINMYISNTWTFSCLTFFNSTALKIIPQQELSIWTRPKKVVKHGAVRDHFRDITLSMAWWT